MAGFWQSAAALVIGGAAVLWARDHFNSSQPAASEASRATPAANPAGPSRSERIVPGAAFDPVNIQSGGTPTVQQNDLNRLRDAAGRP